MFPVRPSVRRCQAVGPIRHSGPADSGASSRLRTSVALTCTTQAQCRPAPLQILQPCGEPETSTQDRASAPKDFLIGAARERMQVTLSLRSRPARPTSASVPGLARRTSRLKRVRWQSALLSARDITDIVRRRAYFIPGGWDPPLRGPSQPGIKLRTISHYAPSRGIPRASLAP